MVGYTDAAKISYMNKVFTDSYKSPASVVVVDSIETIIDYIPIGPRFSAPVLVALKVLIRKMPPKVIIRSSSCTLPNPKSLQLSIWKGRRLLVLATSSNRHMIEEMDMINIFDSEIAINTLTSLESIMAVVESVDLFKPNDQGYKQIQGLLQRKVEERNLRLEIGIKRLLSLIEMARQDVDNTREFMSRVALRDVYMPVNKKSFKLITRYTLQLESLLNL